jgi:hypothetical protein
MELQELTKKFNLNIFDGIPTSKEIMIPFLKVIINGKQYTSNQIIDLLAEYFREQNNKKNRWKQISSPHITVDA